MENELRRAIEKYQENHPEVEEIMRKYRITQEAYEKALAAFLPTPSNNSPTYMITITGKYNVNVSGTA